MNLSIAHQLPASLLRHAAPEDIPRNEDILDARALEAKLTACGIDSLSLVVVGDIMLGGRSGRLLSERGADYPFDAVRPFLRRACFGVGNLEGPMTRAERTDRRYSYRVKPKRIGAIGRAGINVLTLANNHLTDCGRDGVVETLTVVRGAGLTPIGAGMNRRVAHAPAIRDASGLRVGCLGYYWNKRTAARRDVAGSAIGSPENLERDISALRERVDRVLVTFHCGVPYEREPLPEDRESARIAIDCGADAVVSHHTHVVQPFELYRGQPIFYDVGNFTFGSGNSRGEGIVVGLDFHAQHTDVVVLPLYVKNRDPRVNYQPKALEGPAAHRVLSKLCAISGESGREMAIAGGIGRLRCRRWEP